MPQREEVTSRESYLIGSHAPASNTNAVVTLTAIEGRWAIHAITCSTSGTPAAGVQATISGLDDGAGTPVTWKGNIPAAAFMPLHINFNKSLVGKYNTAVVVTLPALGAGISGTVNVFGAKIGR